MEWKIGEIRQINGEWFQCVEGETICSECDLRNIICQRDTSINNPFKECSGNYRTDKKNIIFKKLEKLGEPFERNGYMYQEYKAHTFPLLMSGGAKIPTPNGFAVIIKQNQDMKEKKQKLDKLVEDYSYNRIPYEVFDNCLKQLFVGKQIGENNFSLKEFNLEAAKAGKPVCTRDGRKARIICFDRNDLYPIVALIECEDGKEIIGAYSKEGQTEIYEIKGTNLMMLPEKKEGWVNVYKGGLLDTKSYNTKKKAFDNASPEDYVDTIKINWSE